MQARLGFNIALPMGHRMDGLLFGEAQSRAVLTATPENEAALLASLQAAGVPALLLGRVRADELIEMNGEEWQPLPVFAHAYDTALERVIEGEK
jgi:phosphoribosylformylglycinamidine (FGAM) synthase-like enzyme